MTTEKFCFSLAGMKWFAFLFCLVFAFELQAQNKELDEPLKANAKIAFFGITFIDTSTEGAYNGVREDETARVELLNQTVVKRMQDEGFEIVDNAPVLEDLQRTTNPADCYGCETRMAEALGADYSLVGEVQKVSNLILSMNLVLRDVPDGRMIRGLSVDIRSNTDDSWLRGINYIFKNHYFLEEN